MERKFFFQRKKQERERALNLSWVHIKRNFTPDVAWTPKPNSWFPELNHFLFPDVPLLFLFFVANKWKVISVDLNKKKIAQKNSIYMRYNKVPFCRRCCLRILSLLFIVMLSCRSNFSPALVTTLCINISDSTYVS